MKKPIKKIWSFLILTIAFGLTLAIAGDVLASPCCGGQVYDDFTLNSLNSGNFALSDPVGGSFNPFKDPTYNNRLWLGTDTKAVGPGGVYTPWMFQQYYDSSGYYGYKDYAVDLKSALALGPGGSAGATYTINVAAAGAALVFLNGSSNPSLILNFPNPIAWAGPWDSGTGFPSDQISKGTFTVNFSNSALLNSAGNIPFEVVYFFDKTNHQNQVASGFNFDLNNNPIIYPHENCEPNSVPNPVPEPTTMLLLGSGLVGLAGLKRRFSKS